MFRVLGSYIMQQNMNVPYIVQPFNGFLLFVCYNEMNIKLHLHAINLNLETEDNVMCHVIFSTFNINTLYFVICNVNHYEFIFLYQLL